MPFTGVVGATARAAVDADAEPQNRHYRHSNHGALAVVCRHHHMMPDVQIFARACPMFIAAGREQLLQRQQPGHKAIIAEYLQELKDAGVDTLILGCTHYPC